MLKRPLSLQTEARLPRPAAMRRVVQWVRARLSHRTRLLLLLGTVVSASFGFGTAYGSWTRACAGGACPSIGVLESYRPTEALKVYAADGRLMREVGTQHRTVLSLRELAPWVPAAFIAIEDRRFYQHGGIDFRAIPRALWADLKCLSFCQGFSTITMQLARNVWPEDLPRSKTLQRKVREMRVALELERTYDKDRILEMYLNQIYLGGSAYGVEAGAHMYFGKSGRDVNVAEAALLAAIANVPGYYNPRRYPERALRRRNLVLNVMRDQGYLSPAEAERWKAYPVALSSREDFGDVAPYFVEWVRQQLYARFGEDIYTKGYRVYTTLDLDMQLAAERALLHQLDELEADASFRAFNHTTYAEFLETHDPAAPATARTPYLQGALVTLDADSGYVRAMVGGRDFDHSEFNRAVQAERQAGSTFKPFVYSAAIRANKPASYIIDDGPISIMQNDTMPWEPQNFDERFLGPMTMRRGLFLSRNLVAVRLGMELGVQPVIGEAVRYGISSRLPPFESLFLGAASVIPLEMASAYTAFATLGTQAAPVGILRVEDAKGNIVWEPQVRRSEVMDRQHMWILTSMLRDVVDRGTAIRVRTVHGFPHPAGGKTGTTNDGTDVWFIGFTPELVTAVWMGFDEPKKIMYNAQGGRLAAPVWATYMNEVYERRPAPRPWEQPSGLVLVEIDNTSGKRATPFCPREEVYYEWFIPGTEPTEPCPYHRFRIISIVGGHD